MAQDRQIGKHLSGIQLHLHPLPSHLDIRRSKGPLHADKNMAGIHGHGDSGDTIVDCHVSYNTI